MKKNVKPFMNRSVKLDSMSTRSKMMSSIVKTLSKRNAKTSLKVLFWPFFGPFLALFGNNYFKLMMLSIVKTLSKRNAKTSLKVRKDHPYIWFSIFVVPGTHPPTTYVYIKTADVIYGWSLSGRVTFGQLPTYLMMVWNLILKVLIFK